MILLCYSLAAAIGGGLYEHIVLTPMWSKSPPSSFSIIQPTTGVPLQRFWIPVHAAITLFIILSLMMTWSDMTVRRLLLVALVCYIVMRVWSFLFFIPEMLAFQNVPLDSAPSADLAARVSRWTFRTDDANRHGAGTGPPTSTRTLLCIPNISHDNSITGGIGNHRATRRQHP